MSLGGTKLELVPVSDVDRAKAFYTEKVGFNVDLDHRVERGVDVGEVQEFPAPPDVQNPPRVRFVFFSDPAGNGWAL